MKLPIDLVEQRKKYVLFKNDCGVTDMTRRGGIYEHYIFDYIKDNLQVKDTTIIDIGANFGFHSLEFADLVGENGNVFSFEPQRIVFYQLCANIILNGYNNIYAYNIALGNEHKKVLIENPDYFSNETINIGDAHINKFIHLHNNEIDLKKLDDFNFEKLSVIKIDVQGFEPFVLDGAINTINNHRPYIFIEVETAQLKIYDFNDNDVFDRLKKLNYSIKKVLDAEHLVDYIATPN